MTLHLSYEIIFHVGGLKLAVIDIASSLLKVIQFFLDNRRIVFYVFSFSHSEITIILNKKNINNLAGFILIHYSWKQVSANFWNWKKAKEYN